METLGQLDSRLEECAETHTFISPNFQKLIDALKTGAQLNTCLDALLNDTDQLGPNIGLLQKFADIIFPNLDDQAKTKVLNKLKTIFDEDEYSRLRDEAMRLFIQINESIESNILRQQYSILALQMLAHDPCDIEFRDRIEALIQRDDPKFKLGER